MQHGHLCFRAHRQPGEERIETKTLRFKSYEGPGNVHSADTLIRKLRERRRRLYRTECNKQESVKFQVFMIMKHVG